MAGMAAALRSRGEQSFPACTFQQIDSLNRQTLKQHGSNEKH